MTSFAEDVAWNSAVDFDDAGKKNRAALLQAANTLKPGLARDTPEAQHAIPGA